MQGSVRICTERDLRLLKLGGCDVVLGVNWMKNVSLICFDFNKMEVTFEKEDDTERQQRGGGMQDDYGQGFTKAI